MRRLNILKYWLVGFLTVLVVAGCATSTVESRKKDRYSVYQSLSSGWRMAVDQGHVMVGMPMDAVYIAWGKPDQVSHYGNASGESVTWVYLGHYLQTTQYVGVWRRGGQIVASTSMGYVRAQVNFVNGVVQDWETFPSPN